MLHYIKLYFSSSIIFVVCFAISICQARDEACVLVPKRNVAVQIQKECADLQCPGRMETGIKLREKNAVMCVTKSYHGLEIWTCEAGKIQLQSESIFCEGFITDCAVGDKSPECEEPSWCESTPSPKKRDCKGNGVLVWKWKANGCRDESMCVEKSDGKVLPETTIMPTTINNTTVMSSTVAINDTVSINVTVDKFTVNDTNFGGVFDPTASSEDQDYDLEFFWPLVLIVILPPIYWLLIRTQLLSRSKRFVSITIQLVLVGLVVYVLFTRSHLLHDIIRYIRECIGHWGLSYILIAYSSLQMVRYFVPPFYFCFPLDTVFIAVILLTTPIYQAVLIWQAITFSVCIFGFFALRYLYSDWARRALDNDDVVYFKEIKNLLKVFDEHWSSKFEEASVFWQIIYVSSFFNAEFFSHYIGLFWTAVRNPFKKKVCSSDLTFVCACFIGFILELPAALVQFRLIMNAIDSLEHSRFEIFKEFQWYELIPYFLLTGTATCIVQFHNLLAVVNKLRSLCRALYERKDTLELGDLVDDICSITIDPSSSSEKYDCSIILNKYSPTKSQHYVK